MPISYRIDATLRRVVSTAQGVVSTAELFEHERSLRRDPTFEPDFDQLADFMDVADISVQVSDVRSLADAAPWGTGSRRAGCFSKIHIYGMARMYQAYCELRGVSFRVFLSRDEATAWLDAGDA